MRKLVLLFAFILLGVSANAEEIITQETPTLNEETVNEIIDQPSPITLTGGTVFNWVDITQVERDEQIQQYKEILFGDKIQTFKKKEFKEKYEEFLKDKNWKEHYRLAKLGIKETPQANICAFFFKKDILLIYAIQYKENPRLIYYYNAYGSLQYVDEISENYPNFPYTSKQYRRNGKLVSAIYFTSHDTQYMYGPDGEFTGLWHKEKMFDKNGKQKVTRTNW